MLYSRKNSRSFFSNFCHFLWRISPNINGIVRFQLSPHAYFARNSSWLKTFDFRKIFSARRCFSLALVILYQSSFRCPLPGIGNEETEVEKNWKRLKRIWKGLEPTNNLQNISISRRNNHFYFGFLKQLSNALSLCLWVPPCSTGESRKRSLTAV